MPGIYRHIMEDAEAIHRLRGEQVRRPFGPELFQAEALRTPERPRNDYGMHQEAVQCHWQAGKDILVHK